LELLYKKCLFPEKKEILFVKKLNIAVLAVCLISILMVANPVFAQQSLSKEKKELIEEILELTGVSNLRAEQKLNESNIGDSLMPLLENDKELTDKQKQNLRKSFNEAKERINEKVREFSEDKDLTTRLFKEISFRLYDEKFSESELREMVIFYRTPAGQKTAKFSLTFLNDLSESFSKVFSQKFSEFVNLILNEESEVLKKMIQEIKAPKG
jgi:hypothetical protein